MIGVEGQYQFAFNLAGQSDFLREDDLEHFTMIEDAGGSLPEFEFVFGTGDRDLLSKLNEGARFEVILEDGAQSSIRTRLKIIKPIIERRGRDSYVVTLRGTYHAPGYDKQRVRITDKAGSVQTIRNTVRDYFKTEFDVETSADEQHWIQSGVSDREFVFRTWQHCNLKDSFPLIGITSEGVFRLRDARKMVGKKPALEFSHTGPGHHVDPGVRIHSQTGFSNLSGGYGVSQYQYELGNSPSVVPLIKTEPVRNLFTNSKSLNRAQDSSPRQLPPAFWSPDNVNPEYHEAFRRNLASLMAYTSTSVQVTVRNKLVKGRVLDLAMFRDDDGGVQAIESYSGLYIVTKVARTLRKRNLSNTFIMNREGMNRQTGDLR